MAIVPKITVAAAIMALRGALAPMANQAIVIVSRNAAAKDMPLTTHWASSTRCAPTGVTPKRRRIPVSRYEPTEEG